MHVKFLVVLGVTLALTASRATEANATTDPLGSLRPEHPRLLATQEDWSQLRHLATTDRQLASFNVALLAAARRLLPVPPLRRELIGRRMLGVSRDLVERVLLLGYAWQMTADRRFADRVETELRAVAEFSDWNPSQFLDVAEATAALAIGYDWCYDALRPEARTKIRQAIVEKGLLTGFDPTSPNNTWHRAANNWNQVCLGGLTLGAIAVADADPDLARAVLALARANIAHGLAPYAPDGVYPEGPSYWTYGTTYQVLMIASLESALGTDWGLPTAPGFLASVGGYLQATGPSGNFFNFADGVERGAIAPVVFWFTRKLDDPGLLLFERRHLASWLRNPDGDLPNYFLPLAAVWWTKSARATPAPKLPLRWTGRGSTPIAVFRESWTDPTSLYLAVKGGAAELNHAHMDAGSFVFEVDGVRWAIDLGSQDYESLESKHIDLWNRAQDSQRWQVFRLNHQSHNTLTIGGQPHRVAGHGVITHFSSDANAYALIDLSPVFAGQAGSVRRGFKLLPHRGLLIEDELSGLAPGTSVRWQMLTRAEVACDRDGAVLRQDGRSLWARVISSASVQLTVAPTDPPKDDFNAPNPGVSILSATFLAPADGSLRFGVTLAPESADPTPELAPLDLWTQPSDVLALP